MNGTAIFFWLGLVGLLAVAVVLGRWHAEDMARRIAEVHGQRSVGTRGQELRPDVPWRDVERHDAEFPDGAERASA